jgi:transposase-like protein
MPDNPPPRRYLPRGFPPEELAEARRLYEDTDVPLAEVAAQFGTNRRCLGKLAESEGWASRWSRPRLTPVPRAFRFSEEAIAHIRQRYEDSDDSVESIAESVDADRSTIERLAEQQGWHLRKHRPPRDLPQTFQMQLDAAAILLQARAADSGEAVAAPPPLAQAGECAAEASVVTDTAATETVAPEPANPAAPAAPEAVLSLALRLERAVETQLRKVEDLREDAGADPASRAVEAERIARTLAALTQTLFKVRQLRDPERALSAADDEMPADADGFRLELARRIETFVGGGTDRALPAPGQPPDAGSAAG